MALEVSVPYSPDARMLYSGSIDNTVRLWDFTTGRELRMFRLRSPVVGLAVSPDAKSLAIRSADGDLQLWDIR
jgi:WD40 repeat protein